MNKNQAIQYDYLIVGLGLAGSAIAMHLIKRNRKFMVLDLPDENISSKVAAGIYNPITGKNWVKTWKADNIFPYMHVYYRDIEKLTGRKFLYDRLIYRPFSNLSEQNDWVAKFKDEQFAAYIEEVSTVPLDTDYVNNPYGGLLIQEGGNLDIENYLGAVREEIIEMGCYREEYFDFEKVEFKELTCMYREAEFKKIIFCQGSGARIKKLWGFLPFNEVKGEILTIQVTREFEKIYNKGVFILPSDNLRCKVGATYQRKSVDPRPTTAGRNEIIEKLDAFFKPSYDIVDHKSGIRPATIDRKPFLGMHPNDKKLVIFNGLGAKGVTLAPYFANHLLDSLENDCFLMKEVGIERYFR